MPAAHTILVVDDNVPALKATARVFEQAGYKVAQASDGTAALRDVHALRPSLVLLDVVLPEISGLEVLRQIRSDPALTGVSVVLMSARETTPEQQADGLDAGADGYIARPIPNAELLARVRSQLRQRELTAQLRASEEKFSSAFFHAPIGMALVSPEGSYLKVNRALCRMLGYSEAELLARTFHDITHPEDLERNLGQVRRLLAGDSESFQMEKRYLHQRGHLVAALLNVSLVRDEAGQPVHMIAQIQDITERQQVKAALHESQQTIRLTLDAAQIGHWNLDLLKHTATRSLRHDQIFGYEELRADWSYERFLTHVHPEDREEIDRLFQAGVAAKTKWDFECRIVRPDGALRWIWAHGKVFTNAADEAVRMLGMVSDITERKRTEQATERALQRLSEAQRIGRIGDWEFDLAGQSITWSPQVFEIFGRDPRLGPPRDYEENAAIFEEPSRALMGEKVTAAIASGETQEYELQVRRPGSEPIYVHAFAVPVKDESGRVRTLYGTVQDITARKVAERAVQESAREQRELAVQLETERARLVAAQAVAKVGSWETDLSTLAVIWSAEMYRILEADPEQFYPTHPGFLLMVHPDDRAAVDQAFVQSHDQRSPCSIEHRLLMPDGRIKSVEERWQVFFDEGGKPIRAVGTCQDITERKKAQAALAARARQQAVVAELGQLALMGGEPQELFDRAVVMVAEILGVEYCKVLQLLPDNSALKLVAGVGWREGLVGQATVGVGLDSQAGYALFTKDLVIVEDLRTEKRFKDRPLLREHGVVSGLSVIIGGIEKPFGVMGAHTMRHRTFTIDDAHFFQSIANILAEAIHRKRAEEAMQESERKYRELVELSHDIVWAVDLEGRITYMSPASRHIYGRKPEEMIGHLFTDFMAPDEARRSISNLGKMIASGDPVIDLEARLLHRNGHEIVLSANAMVLRDATGNIVGTTGTSRDITERKRAEEALRESEQRFRELAENIHEVFWMSDPENTRMFYVSPAYDTIWGRSRETLYSSPASWMDAIHPEDKERMVRTRASRDSAFPHDNTYRIVRPDGSVRWIRDRGFPVRDEQGAVVRFAGIAEDVTERKETEKAQERGISLMLATLESTADGILVVNTEGKIEAFNHLFARMWSLPDEVLATKEDARALDCALDQLIEPKKFLEKVRHLYRHPEEESFDRLFFKDGRVFERYSRPQLVGGKVVGRVWSFRDTTERRRAAKALEEANERLRFLSRRLFQVQEDERRHLARELHDEIGQTLTAAKINLQIIAQDVPDKMAGRLDDSIQLIDRLLGQVRQLSLDLRPPLLDELGLVPTLRWLLDQQAQRAGLRVTFHTDVDGLAIDPTIQTTCFRVAQEAITNVIRHSGAKKVVVLLLRKAGRLSLTVRDDGTGFDPAATQQGTAHHFSLGLVSMKERILLVGGGLEVRSTAGKGTEIRAWFPVAVDGQSSRTETS